MGLILKSQSLFGLKMDTARNIFCINLSGQLFKVQEDSPQLYNEMPDSQLSRTNKPQSIPSTLPPPTSLPIRCLNHLTQMEY